MNPFKTLGLDKEVLAGLTDSQIQKLIGKQHRSLSAFFHPDVGEFTSDQRFKDVQEAQKILSDPDEFQRWKALLGRSSKTSRLQEDFLASQKQIESLRKRFADFTRQAAYSELTVYNAAGYKLCLADIVSRLGQIVFSKQIKTHFLLAVGLSGELTRIVEEKSTPLAKRFLFVCINRRVADQQSGINTLLYKVIAPPGTPIHNGYIKGSELHAEANSGAFNGRIPFSRFWEIIEFTTPLIEQDSYVFSLTEENGQYWVILEGSVIHTPDAIIKPVND